LQHHFQIQIINTSRCPVKSKSHIKITLYFTQTKVSEFAEKLSLALRTLLLETLAQDFNSPLWEISNYTLKHMHSTFYVNMNISTNVINSSAALKLNMGLQHFLD